VLEVLRQVDGGHAAGPELALDGIPAGQGGHQAIDQLSHPVHAPFGRTAARTHGAARRGPAGLDPLGVPGTMLGETAQYRSGARRELASEPWFSIQEMKP
jgi:hypothetical protein